MTRATRESVTRKLSDLLDNSKHRTQLKGRTGNYVNGAVEGDPTRGAPRNKINVRIGATKDDPAGRGTIAVWNTGPVRVTTLRSDIPVKIDYNEEGELEVVGCPPSALDQYLGNAAGDADPAPPPPEVNRSILTVRNLLELRPRVDTVDGGLTLWVEPGWHPGGRWPGGRIDQSLEQTATSSMKAWVVTALDPVTNALVMAGGDVEYALPVPPETGFVLDEITALLTGELAGMLPIAAVMIREDQSSFTNNDIFDLRVLFGGNGTGDGNGLPAFGSSDTIPVAGGILDVSMATSRNILVQAESGTTDTVDSIVGLADGEAAVFQADAGDTITFVHSADLVLNNAVDFEIEGDDLLLLVGRSGTDKVAQPIFRAPGGGGVLGSKLRHVATRIYHKVTGTAEAYDTDTADDAGRTGIPQDGDWLEIRVRLKSTEATLNFDAPMLFFNNDTTATNYRSIYVNQTLSITTDNNSRIGTALAQSGVNAADYAELSITIPNYASSTQRKNAFGRETGRLDASSQLNGYAAVNWENDAAITRIQLRTDNHSTDLWDAGSEIEVYVWREEAIGGDDYSTANVSNPPTAAELTAAFGDPTDLPVPFTAVVNDNGAGANEWRVWSDGADWWYVAGTKAT